MSTLLAAQVWHYWLAVVLTALGIVGIVACAILYLWKVASVRYPKQRQA